MLNITQDLRHKQGLLPNLARTFRDAAGHMNQAIAGAANRVTFVAAGLPMLLKG